MYKTWTFNFFFNYLQEKENNDFEKLFFAFSSDSVHNFKYAKDIVYLMKKNDLKWKLLAKMTKSSHKFQFDCIFQRVSQSQRFILKYAAFFTSLLKIFRGWLLFFDTNFPWNIVFFSKIDNIFGFWFGTIISNRLLRNFKLLSWV